MKRHITTIHIEISAVSPDHRDFLAKTIAADINDTLPSVSCRAGVMAKVRRARVSRSRPVRRSR